MSVVRIVKTVYARGEWSIWLFGLIVNISLSSRLGVLQSSVRNDPPFDAFASSENRRRAAEVNVGRRDVALPSRDACFSCSPVQPR